MGLFDKLDIAKVRGVVETGAKMVQENVRNVSLDQLSAEVADAGKKVADGAADALNAGVSAGKDAIQRVAAEVSKQESADDHVGRNVVSLLWFLAHADGVVTDDERVAVAQMAPAFDEEYETYAADLEQDCAARLRASAAEFGAQNAAKVEAGRVLDSMDVDEASGKLLCWNMLALAGADGLDQAELDYIRYVSQRAGVDHAVFEELCNYRRAIDEIEASKERLKSANRSYGEIEPIVSEFSAREAKLVEAAEALVCDR